MRKRTTQSVMAELKSLVDTYEPEYIHFLDETFTKDNLNELVDMMIEDGISQKIRWDSQMRVDVVDDALAAKLKSAGCDAILFGIESGNRQILKAMGKGITLEQATSAVRATKKTK